MVTCICKKAVSVNHILIECPILCATYTFSVSQSLSELFQKNGYDFNACNNARDILYNTDVITSVVKLIVDNTMGKLVQINI